MLLLDELRVELEGYRKDMTELYKILNIDKLKSDIAELQEQSSADGFWNDLENSQKVMQQIKRSEATIAQYNKLNSLLEDTITMIELTAEENGDDESAALELKAEGERFKSELETIKLSTLLTGEYDDKNAIITFHPGAGGTEAQDWAEMLFRMYNMWAERHGFKVTTLDYLDGDEAGIKSASILIEGTNAYGYLKSETGVHRLVRISPFDSSGRRQTSFASLEVMPEMGEADLNIDI
ncbi:MAG: PCRF domain-containing protein, partial [Oscillospiraceae bacterium]|nr:PCRF domain-containing protein [Oscillospiraceae bacterium]